MNLHFSNKVLESISKIHNSAKKCQLKEEAFFKMEPELSFLADKLQISKEQAFFFSIFFTIDFDHSGMDYKSLSRFLDCNIVDVLNFMDPLNELVEMKWLQKRKKSRLGRRMPMTEDFVLSEQVKLAILNNDFPIRLKEEKKKQEVTEVLAEIYELISERDRSDEGTDVLMGTSRYLLEINRNFPLIKRITNFKMKHEERVVLIFLIWEALTGTEKVDMNGSISGIFENRVERVNYIQNLVNGKNPLIRLGLVEVEKGGFINSSDLRLTERCIELLEEDGLKIRNEKPDHNLLDPESIQERTLFFNRMEQEQVRVLDETLKPNRLKEVQKRMKEKSMPSGITVILHGAPGTGKTETVYQLARRTGRSILKVDISETKSKWFGESEKLIKGIFTRYRKTSRSCSVLPILLFNEADAILSKRTEEGGSNMAATENAVQNILLEELERFEGIFMATTNLVGNLDKAFERRFLFKINYTKPGPAVKQKIWKNRLTSLSDAECLSLATEFDLSGGEIENICRKILIQEVIGNQQVSLEEICGFCRTEKYAVSQKALIGFSKTGA